MTWTAWTSMARRRDRGRVRSRQSRANAVLARWNGAGGRQGQAGPVWWKRRRERRWKQHSDALTCLGQIATRRARRESRGMNDHVIDFGHVTRAGLASEMCEVDDIKSVLRCTSEQIRRATRAADCIMVLRPSSSRRLLPSVRSALQQGVRMRSSRSFASTGLRRREVASEASVPNMRHAERRRGWLTPGWRRAADVSQQAERSRRRSSTQRTSTSRRPTTCTRTDSTCCRVCRDTSSSSRCGRTS